MGKIILVRHGQTGPNSERRFGDSDFAPLTELGRRQAHELACSLRARFNIDLILCSEFTRALETAEIIAGVVGAPVQAVSDIHERNFGVLKGAIYEELTEMTMQDPTYDPERDWIWAPPEGESRLEVQQRVLPVLRRVASEHADKEILIVSHGAVIQSVWAHLNGGWEDAHVPPNCGMVLIEVEADSGKLGKPAVC